MLPRSLWLPLRIKANGPACVQLWRPRLECTLAGRPVQGQNMHVQPLGPTRAAVADAANILHSLVWPLQLLLLWATPLHAAVVGACDAGRPRNHDVAGGALQARAACPAPCQVAAAEEAARSEQEQQHGAGGRPRKDPEWPGSGSGSGSGYRGPSGTWIQPTLTQLTWI